MFPSCKDCTSLILGGSCASFPEEPQRSKDSPPLYLHLKGFGLVPVNGCGHFRERCTCSTDGGEVPDKRPQEH